MPKVTDHLFGIASTWILGKIGNQDSGNCGQSEELGQVQPENVLRSVELLALVLIRRPRVA